MKHPGMRPSPGQLTQPLNPPEGSTSDKTKDLGFRDEPNGATSLTEQVFQDVPRADTPLSSSPNVRSGYHRAGT